MVDSINYMVTKIELVKITLKNGDILKKVSVLKHYGSWLIVEWYPKPPGVSLPWWIHIEAIEKIEEL